MIERNVAGAILVKPNGNFLLQERTAAAKRFATKTSLFSGGLHKGETPFSAIKRELEEELGYSIPESYQPNLFIETPYSLPEYKEQGTYSVFIVPVTENAQLVLNDGKRIIEIAGDKLLDLDLDHINRPILEKFLRRNG